MGSSRQDITKTLRTRKIQRVRPNGPLLVPIGILRDALSRKRKRIDRRSRIDPVFRMLSKEIQDEIIEYVNQRWLCAGALFRKWPGPDKKSEDGTYMLDCPMCCPVCGIREQCNNWKCHIYHPLSDMTNCQQWITTEEYLSVLLGHLKQSTISNRRSDEYFKYFRGFHIPEEIDRYVDSRRNKS